MQEKKAEVDNFTVDYKVKELNDIMKNMSSIQDFITEMDYMKNVDINLVYD